MKRISTHLGMAALFLFSFVAFLYWSFPYGVLKEAASVHLEVATGMNVRMAELGPAFPFGFRAKDVEISGGGDSKVQFKSVGVRISLLQLLLLRLGVDIEIDADNKGELDVDLGFPLPALLTGGGLMPSKISLEASSFPLDTLVSYSIKQAVASGAGGPMAGPLLSGLGFRGKLSGNVDLNVDSSSVSQSSGQVKLQFKDAALLLNDPSIGLPDQVFKSAQINATMSGGSLKIDPGSRFESDELLMGADGKINVKNALSASDLDLKIAVKLSGGLGEKFGWVMDGLSGGASKGGNLNLQLRGTFGAPVTTPL